MVHMIQSLTIKYAPKARDKKAIQVKLAIENYSMDTCISAHPTISYIKLN